MGFIVTKKGKTASPVEAPIFVAAPHSTFFDGIACVAAGLPSMVSRSENVQVPLMGSKYWKATETKSFPARALNVAAGLSVDFLKT